MAHPKKYKKPKKSTRTKVVYMTPDDSPIEDDEEGGIFLEKEDIQIIFNALRAYKPTSDEEYLHAVLLEEFEEILVVDYDEPSSNSK